MYNYFDLLEKATIIRDETRNRANTAVRVGNMFIDILNWIEELHQKSDDRFFEEFVTEETAKDEDGNYILDEEGNVITIERKSAKLRNIYEGLWAEGWVSSLGINPNSAALSGSCDLDIIDDEDFFGTIMPSASQLSSLLDVIITDPEEGDVLVYQMTGNGLKWVNGKVFGNSEYASKLGSVEGFWTYQSLVDEFAKYVTLDSEQTITGKKTFANAIILKSGEDEIEISIDTINHALKVNGAAYTTSWLSALGINSHATSVISVSGSPESGQNAIVGYSWDPTNQHLTFNYGTITGGGSGVIASWGSTSDNKASLTIGTTTKTVLLDGALSGYLTSVSWSNIAGTTPIWNQDTTGNAASATKLRAKRSLWGNDFDGSADISGSIILGSGKKLFFGEDVNIEYANESINISTATTIDEGPIIEYDRENKAYHIHGNLYTDGWTSSLGMNNDAENVISVSGSPASGQNVITGYTWNPTTKHLEFSFGKIVAESPDSGGASGGGTDVSWGRTDNSTYAILDINGDWKSLLLESALNGYLKTVSWSDIKGSVPTWNQDTTGNAASATKLRAKRSLWGNDFDGTSDIDGTITLAPGKNINFGSGNTISYNSEYSRFNINRSLELGWSSHLKIGSAKMRWVDGDGNYYLKFYQGDDDPVAIQIGGCRITWMAGHKALKFSSAIYSESWISALGANSATIDEVTVRTLSASVGVNTKTLKVGNSSTAGVITLYSGVETANPEISGSDGNINLSAGSVKVSGTLSIESEVLSISGESLTKTQLQKLKKLIV